MYILFTTFAASLLALIVMVGRKVSLVRSGEAVQSEHPHPFVPELEKAKNFTYENLKKYEHVALVLVIRLYVKALNFLKEVFYSIGQQINKIHLKDKGDSIVQEITKEQVSGFLKMMSDYKYRIRHIKHRIKKEEEKS